jgi:DNA/RNA-binding domain of Phe-tRNA-synthetase-like protein
MTEIRVHAKIFEEYSTFRRAIVVARNIQNRGHSRELEDRLSAAIAQAAQQPIDLKADPRTTAWNAAHRQFGSNPNKFPPAHCYPPRSLATDLTNKFLLLSILRICRYHS